MTAAPGADAEADAYFESLIARVDQAVAGNATDGAPEEQSPLWFQMLNYHSLTGLCVRDRFDPFPIGKRVYLFILGTTLNFFLSTIFTKDTRQDALRTWLYVAIAWFPIFFVLRLLLRRPDVSNKYWFYPWVSFFLLGCFLLACVLANVLGAEDVGATHTADATVTCLISLSSNWAIEALLLAGCLLGENPCLRTTVDDRWYLEDVGLDNDEYSDTYTPPFEEGAKGLPSVIDI
eukprot:g2298.t1